jgi:excisionase family DNA binding protein
MKYLSIGEAALVLGVAVSTLRRWESEGRLAPNHRTFGGHRRYELTSLQQLISPEIKDIQRVVGYARVSSHDQKGDLVRQAQRLKDWGLAQNIESMEVIEDLGSGLNYKKKGLKKLLRMIAHQQISHLVVMHKDRLLRFGSELLFDLCRLNNIKVTVVEENEEASSYEQRLAADVIELMTVFSARLYGRRSHQNRQKSVA